MKMLTVSLAVVCSAFFLPSCATSRSPFAPAGGPPTVGMPAELSERERAFVPRLDGVLRDQGFLPVRYGAGDMQLEFEIAEGPINTDTRIELREGRRIVASGQGRGTGAPAVGRSRVAERSFERAFEQFRSSLPGTAGGGYGGPPPDAFREDVEYVY